MTLALIQLDLECKRVESCRCALGQGPVAHVRTKHQSCQCSLKHDQFAPNRSSRAWRFTAAGFEEAVLPKSGEPQETWRVFATLLIGGRLEIVACSTSPDFSVDFMYAMYSVWLHRLTFPNITGPLPLRSCETLFAGKPGKNRDTQEELAGRKDLRCKEMLKLQAILSVV